jgi:hypothetical protein
MENCIWKMLEEQIMAEYLEVIANEEEYFELIYKTYISKL